VIIESLVFGGSLSATAGSYHSFMTLLSAPAPQLNQPTSNCLANTLFGWNCWEASANSLFGAIVYAAELIAFYLQLIVVAVSYPIVMFLAITVVLVPLSPFAALFNFGVIAFLIYSLIPTV